MNGPTKPGTYWAYTPWTDWQIVAVRCGASGRLRVYGPNEPIEGTAIEGWPMVTEWHGPLDLKPPRATS